MKVVITSATEGEARQIKDIINISSAMQGSGITVSFHESGIGILSSCYSIAELIFTQKPDLIIQAGIAGSFIEKHELGKVVVIRAEYLADTGVEENGRFKDLFDLNLQHADLFPYQKKMLSNPWLEKMNYLQLEEVTGITVNEITTRPERIKELKEKYNAEVESMEGASLHYCCLKTSTPFIQIRAVSNYVGERDKSKWKFKEAFENLADVVVRYIGQLNSDLQV